MFVSSLQIAFLHSVIRPFVYIGYSAELAVTKKLSQVIKNIGRCHFIVIKLLGVYITNDLKWTHHVENIVKNGNERLYSLKVLKQCGAPPASLAKVYTTVFRPALEYAAPVWQNIPNFLSYKIESIQKRAKCIIFPLMNYNEALNALNLTTLCERRAHLCQVYIDRLRNKSHPLHLMLPKWEEYI